MKYVLLYDSADDVMSNAPRHYPAHAARADEFHARGTLLMIGAFGDPQDEGAMGIFTSREAAEEFVAGDPFVLNGVIRDWHSASGTTGSPAPEPPSRTAGCGHG
jgi:uncharacterized protein